MRQIEITHFLHRAVDVNRRVIAGAPQFRDDTLRLAQRIGPYQDAPIDIGFACGEQFGNLILNRWMGEYGQAKGRFGNQYIVALITEVREEGLPDAKTIRPQVEAFIRNQKKATQLISKIGNSRDLTAIATSFNTNVMRADSISFAAPFIPNVGNEAIVIGAAFNTQQQGKVSDPFAGSIGVFVIKTESLGMKPSSDPGYAIRRMQKEQSIKGNLAYKSSDALRKSVKITDNRIDFY
jgi:peptidyl-prolyl cis-trans isomerase D